MYLVDWNDAQDGGAVCFAGFYFIPCRKSVLRNEKGKGVAVAVAVAATPVFRVVMICQNSLAELYII